MTLAIAAAALPAAAEVATFKAGQKLMVTAKYDGNKNRFTKPAPQGEETACFEVLEVRQNSLRLSLVAVTFRPWWSDSTYRAGGYDDEWFSSDTYTAKHPNAQPMGELRGVFTEVPACAGGS